jgi:hypothetical protein
MDSRNWFELVIRNWEVEQLPAQQKTILRLELMALEDKLGQILERYNIEH